MTDKEVGEVWRDKGEGHDDWWYDLQITALIRKLVEERQKYYEERGFLIQGRDMALQEFGIDPKDWPA